MSSLVTNDRYASHIFSQFRSFRESQELIDLVLTVEGTEFSCHRIVMAACSPYFHAMFSSGMTEANKKNITIHEVSTSAMTLIIGYAYTSRLELTLENVYDLHTAANFLQIDFIQTACENFIISHMTVQNCLEIFSFASTYFLTNLKLAAKTVIEDNFIEATAMKDFLSLTPSEVHELFLSDSLEIQDEKMVFDAAVAWINEDELARTSQAALLWGAVRWSLMDEGSMRSAQDCVQESKLTYPEKYLAAIQELSQKERADKLRMGMRNTDLVVCINLRENVERMSASPAATSLPLPAISPTTGAHYSVTGPTVVGYGLVVTPSNDIYIAGGYKPIRPENLPVALRGRTQPSLVARGQNYGVPRADFSVYNHRLDQWTKQCSMLTARRDCQLVYAGGCIYAIGGSRHVHGIDVLYTVECYNMAENYWQFVAPIPSGGQGLSRPRRYPQHFSAIGLGQTVYVIEAEHTYSFNPEENAWTELAPMHCPRYGVKMAAVGPDIYCVGGVSAISMPHMIPVQVFSPQANTWRRVSDFPPSDTEPLYGVPSMVACVAVLHKTLHVLVKTTAGHGQPLFKLYGYSSEEDRWTLVSETPAPRSISACTTFALARFNSQFLVQISSSLPEKRSASPGNGRAGSPAKRQR